MSAAKPLLTTDHHKKEILELTRKNSLRSGLRESEVFNDFLELSAIAISNAMNKVQFEAREVRYLQILKRYDKAEIARFPGMLGHLVEALEFETSDVLGSMYMSLDLGDAWRGQFFTPWNICSFMARLTIGTVTAREVEERGGFLTLQEPAAGAGGMILAAAEALREQGINPQTALCVEARDIAAPCVWMSYIQLSLSGIPACVVHGNTLSGEVHSRWYTPAYVLGFWHNKLRRRAEQLKDLQPLAPIAMPIQPSAVGPARVGAPTAARPQMTLF